MSFHLPEKLAGVMMGTAAGLERFPTMLIAGYFAKRLEKTPVNVHRRCRRTVLLCGYVAGARTGALLSALQLLNAIYRHSWRDWRTLFSGSDAEAGRVYFTLYTNTIRVGWIICRVSLAVAAEIWNYHMRSSGLR